MFFRHHFFPTVIIDVQSGNGVLNRLIPCMELAITLGKKLMTKNIASLKNLALDRGSFLLSAPTP